MAFVDRVFSTAETKVLSAPGQGYKHAFLDAWTRREAFLKARGGGLSLPVSHFDVSLSPGPPAALLATRLDSTERERWHLQSRQVAQGHAAALAIEKSSGQKLLLNGRILEVPQ